MGRRRSIPAWPRGFRRQRPELDPRPEFATCLVCGDRLSVRLRDGGVWTRMPTHHFAGRVCRGSDRKILPYKRKHGEAMEVPARNIKSRSGYLSSVIVPILTLAIAWLTSIAGSFDGKTTTGLLLGIAATGVASALTFLKKALTTGSVDPVELPPDLVTVKLDGKVLNPPSEETPL